MNFKPTKIMRLEFLNLAQSNRDLCREWDEQVWALLDDTNRVEKD